VLISRDVVGVLKSASEERGDTLGTCFSLTHGTAFALSAAQIFRAMEDEDAGVAVRHPGPVTLGSLKQHAAVLLPFSLHKPICPTSGYLLRRFLLARRLILEWRIECQLFGFQGEDAFGVGGTGV